jgi:hypothetical protein
VLTEIIFLELTYSLILSKKFNIFRTSEDYGSPLKRRICVDIDAHNSKEIRDYLYSNQDEFLKIANRILTLPNMYYDGYKQEYKEGKYTVSAMRFYDIQNTRIYCQEMTNKDGQFFIICAKVFVKKSEKNNKKNIPLLKEISDHEYIHKP